MEIQLPAQSASIQRNWWELPALNAMIPASNARTGSLESALFARKNSTHALEVMEPATNAKNLLAGNAEKIKLAWNASRDIIYIMQLAVHVKMKDAVVVQEELVSYVKKDMS